MSEELVLRIDPVAIDISDFQKPIPVMDDDSFAQAAAHLNLAKDVLKGWKQQDVYYGTPALPGSIVKANDAHKSLMASYNKTAKPLETYIANQVAEMAAFDTRKRIAAAREETERKRAEAEREAEVRREAEKLKAQAEALRKDGLIKEARQMEQTPAVVAPAVGPISRPPAKVAGLQTKYQFKGRVVNLQATIKAVAEFAIPLNYVNADGEEEPLLYINESLLNHLARIQQKDLAIPGCVAEEVPSYAKGR